ncbi:MAG: spore coat U domain-containing protein [Chromatiales bacterium]|nr:spore coat U domain-containing protein [Chromatiales bacterium]
MQVRPPQLCTDAAPQWYALRSMDLPTERKSRIRARTLAVLLLMLGATMTNIASAQNCTITAVPLNFGSYLPNDLAPLDNAGAVDIDCKGRGGIFLVTIAAGNSNDYLQRLMLSATDALAYNVYLDAARTQIWGNWSSGTSALRRFRRNGRYRESIPVYGRIFAGQDVDPGIYSDSLLVTIIF